MGKSPSAPFQGASGLEVWSNALCVAYGETSTEIAKPGEFQGWYGSTGNSRLSQIVGNVSRVCKAGDISPYDEQSVFLVFAEYGEAEMRQSGARCRLGSGGFTIADPKLPWDYRFSEPFSHYSMIIPRSLMAMHPSGPEAALLLEFDGGRRTARAIAALLSLLASEECLERDRADTEEIAYLRAAVLDIVAGALASSDEHDSNISRYARMTYARALKEIEDDFRDGELTATKLASAMNLSRRSLHRLFHQHGTTVSMQILRIRLAKVCRDLSNPALRSRSITEIALTSGFNDISHFSRTFRRRFGVSASAYRSQM